MNIFSLIRYTEMVAGPGILLTRKKIIGLIYYYVKYTGDIAFLKDSVGGITVLDHVIKNAMFVILALISRKNFMIMVLKGSIIWS